MYMLLYSIENYIIKSYSSGNCYLLQYQNKRNIILIIIMHSIIILLYYTIYYIRRLFAFSFFCLFAVCLSVCSPFRFAVPVRRLCSLFVFRRFAVRRLVFVPSFLFSFLVCSFYRFRFAVFVFLVCSLFPFRCKTMPSLEMYVTVTIYYILLRSWKMLVCVSSLYIFCVILRPKKTFEKNRFFLKKPIDNGSKREYNGIIK